MRTVILIVIAFLLLSIIWSARYTIYPTHSSISAAYKLDRWTGKVTRLWGVTETQMVEREPAKKESVFPDLEK